MMRGLVAAAALAFSATAAFAQRAVEFEGRYWFPQMDGRIRVQNGGTDIDLIHDLGFQDRGFPGARFTFQTAGRSRIQFTFTPLEDSGDRVITRTIVFDGKPYVVGARVVSQVEMQHLQLGWAYQFVNVGDGFFRFGTLVEANGFVNMRGALDTAGVRGSEEFNAGLPAAGIAMDLNPAPRVRLYAQAAGLPAGKYGYFANSEAGVQFRPMPVLFLTAGYRTFHLDANYSEDYARLRQHGPFVGAGVRF